MKYLKYCENGTIGTYDGQKFLGRVEGQPKHGPTVICFKNPDTEEKRIAYTGKNIYKEEEQTVTYYYDMAEFNYKIEYYYDGIIDDSKTDTIEARFADVITHYEDKVIDGYKLSREENLPLTVDYIEANNELMKQVFINLIDNAIKYTEEGDKIEINTFSKDGMIQIKKLHKKLLV